MIFQNSEYDNHEEVLFFRSEKAGFKSIIAIHDTTLGPALGGCRMYPYSSEEEAIWDVLRLSKGMTYKSALAGLPLGGGKSVIIGDPRKDKTDLMMLEMGRFVQRVGGRYIVAEDSGTHPEDISKMHITTPFVSGVMEKAEINLNGDPSPITAYGVFVGIKASVKHRLGKDSLKGIRVNIQGSGNVGQSLIHLLIDAGAIITIADIFEDQIQRVLKDYPQIKVIDPNEILSLPGEVFCPCALGAVISNSSAHSVGSPIVAGAANNQLENSNCGDLLWERDILYAPDYVINAGGIIDVAYERVEYDYQKVLSHCDKIGHTLNLIYSKAGQEDRATNYIADEMAQKIIRDAKGG